MMESVAFNMIYILCWKTNKLIYREKAVCLKNERKNPFQTAFFGQNLQNWKKIHTETHINTTRWFKQKKIKPIFIGDNKN